MSVNISAFDTVYCSGFPREDISSKVKRAYLTESMHTLQFQLKGQEDPISIYLVQGGNAYADVIPFFVHPVSFMDSGKVHYAADVRHFGRWHAPSGSFAIRNKAEYDWTVKRTVLNHLWTTERPEQLRDLSTLPASLYTSLIKETVTRRFMLNGHEQDILSILSAYFYYGHFTNEEQFDENEFRRIAMSISRATKIAADKVMEVIEGLPVISNLSVFCDVIKQKVENVSMENFGLSTLTAVVANNWMGTKAPEILMVGLEHIPTWTMIAYACMGDATFRRSSLTKLAQKQDQRGVGAALIKGVDSLLDGLPTPHTAI